jgi:threonine aldolase
MRAPVDLRSDTVTMPTPAMRQAMAGAAVGDDVYGEDPTVNLLQVEVAGVAGAEAALYMPSGTMCNQAALAAHTRRGEEVIAPEGAHVYEYELGMMAALAGLVPRIVPAPKGVPAPADVRAAIGRSKHQAPTGLIVLENTHNRAGGTVVPIEVARELRAIADAEGLPLHLDGARAWNAAVALEVDLRTVCEPFDSVSLCLSKGLGAPVGSVLVGTRRFIDEAHRYRKMMGGGMRQAGVIAAAALVALREGPARLAADHRRARRLGEGLAAIPGFEVDLETVQTNMVYARVPHASRVAAGLAERGVLVNPVGPGTLRFVTHHQVGDEAIELALGAAAEVARAPVAG